VKEEVAIECRMGDNEDVIIDSLEQIKDTLVIVNADKDENLITSLKIRQIRDCREAMLIPLMEPSLA